ncbi:Immediate early response 2 protein [Crotalus adamanteus]|uniref:Immediate early response 2 protein n=1 Tax=Crotalus adamanteus TaxID=8729 RepID=A0AAW1BP73_CROAD
MRWAEEMWKIFLGHRPPPHTYKERCPPHSIWRVLRQSSFPQPNRGSLHPCHSSAAAWIQNEWKPRRSPAAAWPRIPLPRRLGASISQQDSLGKIAAIEADLVPSKKAKLAEEEGEWQPQKQEGPFPSLAES